MVLSSGYGVRRFSGDIEEGFLLVCSIGRRISVFLLPFKLGGLDRILGIYLEDTIRTIAYIRADSEPFLGEGSVWRSTDERFVLGRD